MCETSDAELMGRYADGDSQAFDELFRRYEGRAYAFFRRRTGSEERAQDLYQELFLRLHRFRDRYDRTQPFAPWFFRVARRVWLDELRRLHGRRESSLEARAEPVREPDTERRVIARGELERLLAFVSGEQAQIVMAVKLGGFEYSELARDLGKSLDAVKQSGSRALRRLRRAASADP
jgi:RNA polymerase sigma factor (sigma-70 family)